MEPRLWSRLIDDPTDLELARRSPHGRHPARVGGRGWQPSSLFAAAAVASVAAELERRRNAPHGGVADRVAPTQLVTPVEAARMLRVGRTTIYRLAKEHQLTRIRIGRCARFVRSEIDDFIESRLAEARCQPDG